MTAPDYAGFCRIIYCLIYTYFVQLQQVSTKKQNYGGLSRKYFLFFVFCVSCFSDIAIIFGGSFYNTGQPKSTTTKKKNLVDALLYCNAVAAYSRASTGSPATREQQHQHNLDYHPPRLPPPNTQRVCFFWRQSVCMFCKSYSRFLPVPFYCFVSTILVIAWTFPARRRRQSSDCRHEKICLGVELSSTPTQDKSVYPRAFLFCSAA